jgi:alkylhydroperoxidase family enzyme
MRASPGRGVRAMVGLQRAVETSGLEPLLLELVKMRASQINGCACCLDITPRTLAPWASPSSARTCSRPGAEASRYDARERAALAWWCEDLALISHRGTPDASYEALERAFSPAEIVALTLAIVAINGWNRLAISMRAPAGKYVSPHRATSNASGAGERIAQTRTPTNRE